MFIIMQKALFVNIFTKSRPLFVKFSHFPSHSCNKKAPLEAKNELLFNFITSPRQPLLKMLL